MGRTIPAWRMVVNSEIEKMRNFQVFLRTQDQIIFEDMMNQCKLYASYASVLASPNKEFPLILSMLFAHHKMLWEHQKHITTLLTLLKNKTDTTSNNASAEQEQNPRMPALASTR